MLKSSSGVKINLSVFNEKQVRIIYNRAVDMLNCREQWIGLKKWDLAATYEAKLEALIELLETILVFNIGNGADAFGVVSNNTTDKRLESIKNVVLLFDDQKRKDKKV